jgi:hypothetical protein
MTAPALGYLIDKGAQPDSIMKIAIIYYLIHIVLVAVAVTSEVQLMRVLSYIPKWEIHNADKEEGIERARSGLAIYVFFSFSLTSIGLVGANALASMYPDYRAMLVQTVAIFTFSGTALHIFVVDPILARAADKSATLTYNTI